MTFSSDRIKHLEFMQATITRQASNSFTIKGWSLTVSGAIYAYTASHLTWWLAVVSLLPAIAFAFLDVFYLRQERLFRELYRDASRPILMVPVFDMSTQRYQNASLYPRCTRRDVWKSASVWMLHGAIILVGIILLGVSIFQEFRSTELANCLRHTF